MDVLKWGFIAYGCFMLAVFGMAIIRSLPEQEDTARMIAVAAADAPLTDADAGREHAAVTVTVYELPGLVEACGGVFTREEIDALVSIRHRGAVVARRRAMTVQEAR